MRMLALGVTFYLLWITDLDSLAHVNEARAE